MAELELARMGFTVADSFSAWLPIAFAPAANTLLESDACNCVSAAMRALDATVPLNPARAKDPVTGMLSGTLVVPVVNSTVPSSDVITGKPVPALYDATVSARRPPQPVPAALFEIELCHCACWSEWEYSDNGRCPALYWSCEVGASSVPTLARTAALFCLKSDCTWTSAGCNPSGIPVLTGWIGSREPWASWMPDTVGRAVAYCAYPALSSGMTVLLPSFPPNMKM